MSHKNGTLACDGWCQDAPNPVTHLGSKGWVYCQPCAERRRASGYERARKMTDWELDAVQSGAPLHSYKPVTKAEHERLTKLWRHCPNCQARPGEPCTQPTNTTRRPVKWFHSGREAIQTQPQEATK